MKSCDRLVSPMSAWGWGRCCFNGKPQRFEREPPLAGTRYLGLTWPCSCWSFDVVCWMMIVVGWLLLDDCCWMVWLWLWLLLLMLLLLWLMVIILMLLLGSSVFLFAFKSETWRGGSLVDFDGWYAKTKHQQIWLKPNPGCALIIFELI